MRITKNYMYENNKYGVLFFIWLFGSIDLFFTYIAIRDYGLFELSPLYHLGGWGLLVFVKYIFPVFVFYIGENYKRLIFLMILLFITVGAVYWNLFVLLSYFV